MGEKLDTGDAFPEMRFALASGGTRTLPDEIDANFQIVLFYRGHW